MEQGFTIKNRAGAATAVRLDTRGKHGKQRFRLQHTTAIPTTFLDARAAERAMSGRAPLGDSHGAFQKIAEIPLHLLFSKIPPDQWEDQKALAKLLNDPDIKAFRSDAPGRRF